MLQSKFMLFAVVALMAVGSAIAIINGKDATRGQFPYYAQLEIYKLHRTGVLILTVSRKVFTKCGASVISNQYLLTAAQCLDGSDGVEVNLGALRLFDEKEKGRQIVDVSKKAYRIHPAYKQNVPLINDIALIKLPSPVQFSDYVQPIHLSFEPTTAEMNALTMGYGLVSFNEFAQNLQYTNMETVDLKECLSKKYNLTSKNSLVCAKGTQSSLCIGDVGGPLVSIDTGKLIGISIYIGGDCELNRPEGFTGIIPYIEWIKEVTGGVIRNY